MGKVSIGLRGWRFEEEEVFTEDGEFRPMDRMPNDTRRRLVRLSALVGSPCNACWLIHGDEQLPECNVAEVVYGEPLGEVAVCREHEPDFLYWFAEEGGAAYKGQQELQDEFHEWFADGGRAPDGYGGVEHVDTDPDDLPDPPEPDMEAQNVDVPEGEQKRIDLRNGEVREGEVREREANEGELDDDDLDLGRDYPKK